MGLVGKSGHLVIISKVMKTVTIINHHDQDEQDEKKGESLLKVKRPVQSLPNLNQGIQLYGISEIFVAIFVKRQKHIFAQLL